MNNTTIEAPKRIEGLDSLRGIAAAVVVLGHGAQAFGFYGMPSHSSVMLFFVLSGFVLAFPWVEGRPLSWPKFLIRRALRLWPPAVVAVLVAACIDAAHIPITADLLGRCIFLTGQHGGCDLDHPLWSLVFEARVSAVFPILALVVLRVRWPVALISAVVMVGIAEWLLGFGIHGELTGEGLIPSILTTIHYAGLFAFGILLAARGGRAVMLGGRFPLIALTVAAAIMSVPSDIARGFGAAILIATATGSGTFGRVLQFIPFRWMGRVSYSLYLIHLPIIVVMQRMSGDFITVPNAVVAVVLSGIAAEVMHRMIEAPSIRLGRWLTPPQANARTPLVERSLAPASQIMPQGRNLCPDATATGARMR
jgi:peptidoglycan/LPS O-acetylase OafA/YrhL